MKGKMIKGIGGFYYVKTSEGIIECKARGKFRHRDMKPLVGDDVEIVVENGKRIASFSISMKLSVHDKHEKQTKTDTIRYCDM